MRTEKNPISRGSSTRGGLGMKDEPGMNRGRRAAALDKRRPGSRGKGVLSLEEATGVLKDAAAGVRNGSPQAVLVVSS